VATGKKGDRMAVLEAENLMMEDALTKIANTDYRGNRPYEAVIAYEALRKVKELRKRVKDHAED